MQFCCNPVRKQGLQDQATIVLDRTVIRRSNAVVTILFFKCFARCGAGFGGLLGVLLAFRGFFWIFYRCDFVRWWCSKYEPFYAMPICTSVHASLWSCIFATLLLAVARAQKRTLPSCAGGATPLFVLADSA